MLFFRDLEHDKTPRRRKPLSDDSAQNDPTSKTPSCYSLDKKSPLHLISLTITTIALVAVGVSIVALCGCGNTNGTTDSYSSTDSHNEETVNPLPSSNAKEEYTLTEALTSGDYPVWYETREKEPSYSSYIYAVYTFDGNHFTRYDIPVSTKLNLESIDGKTDEEVLQLAKDVGEVTTGDFSIIYWRTDDGKGIEDESIADLLPNGWSIYDKNHVTHELLPFREYVGPTTVMNDTYFGIGATKGSSATRLIARAHGGTAPNITNDELTDTVPPASYFIEGKDF